MYRSNWKRKRKNQNHVVISCSFWETGSEFFVSLVPLRGRHQSSIYPDNGEEWHERTEFVIFYKFLLILIRLEISIWLFVCLCVISHFSSGCASKRKRKKTWAGWRKWLGREKVEGGKVKRLRSRVHGVGREALRAICKRITTYKGRCNDCKTNGKIYGKHQEMIRTKPINIQYWAEWEE